MDGVDRVETSMIEAAAAETRSRKRDSMFMTAKLWQPNIGPVFEVRVRNLSTGGLMVELDRPLDPGAAVLLHMHGLGEISGTVAWSTRGRVGIALDHEIDPRRARKPVRGGTTTPEYAKPALHVVRTTGW
jgi:hypothetical protein